MAGKNKNKRSSLWRKQNWFVSAGLVLLIYFVLLYALYSMAGDNSLLMKMAHALPLIAVLMAGLGFWEKRRDEEREGTRAKNRYAVRMEMSKAQRELGALAQAADKKVPASAGSERGDNETK